MRKRTETLSLGTNICSFLPPPDPPPSLSQKSSDKEANHWRLNVSNSFSKPGSKVTVIIPFVISTKARKHLQTEECYTYNLGMCDAAVYLKKKKNKTTCYIYRLSFLVKDNTTLGKAEEICEKQESLFHTVNL